VCVDRSGKGGGEMELENEVGALLRAWFSRLQR
jgi:hypothetical protein